jgi:hypothetical protein
LSSPQQQQQDSQNLSNVASLSTREVVPELSTTQTSAAKVRQTESDENTLTINDPSNSGFTSDQRDLIISMLPLKRNSIKSHLSNIDFQAPIRNIINEINPKVGDYLLILAAERIIPPKKNEIEEINKIDEIKKIISEKNKYITDRFDEMLTPSNKKKITTQNIIDTYLDNPSSNSSFFADYKNSLLFQPQQNNPQLSRPSSAASSRPSTSSLRQSGSFESNCKLLDKTLMIELTGDMRQLASGLKTVPEMCKFFLSNKRYCYHIMRSDGNDYLKQLISYFYIDKSLHVNSPTIPNQAPPNNFDNSINFPDIKQVFDSTKISSVNELVIQENTKKNVLFILKPTTKLNKIKIPRILSTNYVLVSFMITSTPTKTSQKSIKNESIPENDNSGYTQVTVTDGSQIILNYQYMRFPPTIDERNIFEKIQSRSVPRGGNKTIRKYRKHNRNKTTRNYK